MQPQHGAISSDGLETKVGRLVVLVAYKLVVVEPPTDPSSDATGKTVQQQ